MRWPKYWSFSFSIISSKEIQGLISFKMDLLDLLAVQGTLKSLLQYHSSKASVLQCSALFMVQFSSMHDYWKKSYDKPRQHIKKQRHYFANKGLDGLAGQVYGFSTGHVWR